ncbi:amino acid ABC transporter permease [Nitratireductor sp.]|uniref:amino acid ABC transporter permease n=1 Tax=Nitratireductor sp. TaxID=1872084 RepID=UPI00260969FF|nr:amino acid ABC transporter permease [Nitratireductor sp.]MCV0378341.1 amino acid ABC transporter permease [Nitratireductor sp.]
MSYAFEWDSIIRAWPYLMQGLQTTLLLLVTGVVLGVGIGTVLAICRMFGPRPLAALTTGYVNLFRSIPLILTIFWFYIMMPSIMRALTGDPNLTVGPIYAALAALVMAEAAYFCEIIRAGIGSVRQGQMQASLSLGLTRWQALSNVILPQAFRNMTPSLLNQTIALLKDTSLVYVISMNDFLGAAVRIGQRDGRVVEVFIFVAAVYLVVCWAGTWLAEHLQKKLNTGKS